MARSDEMARRDDHGADAAGDQGADAADWSPAGSHAAAAEGGQDSGGRGAARRQPSRPPRAPTTCALELVEELLSKLQAAMRYVREHRVEIDLTAAETIIHHLDNIIVIDDSDNGGEHGDPDYAPPVRERESPHAGGSECAVLRSRDKGGHTKASSGEAGTQAGLAERTVTRARSGPAGTGPNEAVSAPAQRAAKSVGPGARGRPPPASRDARCVPRQQRVSAAVVARQRQVIRTVLDYETPKPRHQVWRKLCQTGHNSWWTSQNDFTAWVARQKTWIENSAGKLKLVCLRHSDFPNKGDTDRLLSWYRELATYPAAEFSQIQEFGAYKIVPLRLALGKLKTVEVRGAVGAARLRKPKDQDSPEIFVAHSSLPRKNGQQGSTKILLALKLTFLGVQPRASLHLRKEEVGGDRILTWVGEQGQSYEHVALYHIDTIYKIPLTKGHL